MMISFGRRRLSIRLGSSHAPASPGAPLIGAESDAELARLAAGGNAARVRAEQELSRILYAGPPLR